MKLWGLYGYWRFTELHQYVLFIIVLYCAAEYSFYQQQYFYNCCPNKLCTKYCAFCTDGVRQGYPKWIERTLVKSHSLQAQNQTCSYPFYISGTFIFLQSRYSRSSCRSFSCECGKTFCYCRPRYPFLQEILKQHTSILLIQFHQRIWKGTDWYV